MTLNRYIIISLLTLKKYNFINSVTEMHYKNDITLYLYNKYYTPLPRQ